MRLKITLTGLVQGVGFRPFVYRVAKELGLKGYVLNNASGILIEAEGVKTTLDSFLIRIQKERPAISRIFSIQHSFLEDRGFSKFEILDSSDKGEKRITVLPDISTCDECLNEVTDPGNRRFMYPFINCTNCGPRFTIIHCLPYDRVNTSMRAFSMCNDCSREYNQPSDRRFHAQPDACHDCGPWITLFDSNAKILCEKEEALERSINLIRRGYIMAVKGIGGFHLICDATNEEAVVRLRQQKHREEKPMAVMFPSIDDIGKSATINHLESRAIEAVERPIVIVNRNEGSNIARSVSPDNQTIGVFLPYTPLHYLILRKLRRPVVATSANITDEPIVKDESDAFSRLGGIVDYYLVHNRDIIRRCDDSVVRIMADRQVPIRRSRGYVPLPVTLPFRFQEPVLALGPYMNNTIAVGIGNEVYLSQHIGDLDTSLSEEFYDETVSDFLRLLEIEPKSVISDMHPGYYSTRYGVNHYHDRLLQIQHHHAHIISCMADNEIPEDSRVLGFAFDGTGFGTDGTIWGSEAMIATYKGFRRVAHLYPFRLPGGDKCVKEPRRTALALLYETFGDNVLDMNLLPLQQRELKFLLQMIKKDINSPVTTSMGRLFDAVASMINLVHKVSYHAQAAIMLEQLAMKSDTTKSYNVIFKNGIIHFQPVINEIVSDINNGASAESIARSFHNTIINLILHIAKSLKSESSIRYVALSGGVFQNSILLEESFKRLEEEKFIPLIHQRVPPNDGGISLGQAVAGIFLKN